MDKIEQYREKYRKEDQFIGTIGPPKSNNPNGGEIYCKICSASTWIGVGSINHDKDCPVINPKNR